MAISTRRGNFITCKSKFPIIPKDVDGNSFERHDRARRVTASVVPSGTQACRVEDGLDALRVSPRLQFMVIDRLVEPEEGTGAPSLDDAL